MYSADACLGPCRQLLPCWFPVPLWTTPQLAFAVASLLKDIYNANACLDACGRLLCCRFSMPWWIMPRLAFAVPSLLKGMYNADACLVPCRQLLPNWFRYPSGRRLNELLQWHHCLLKHRCLRSFFSKQLTVASWKNWSLVWTFSCCHPKLGLICRCLIVLSLNVYLKIIALCIPNYAGCNTNRKSMWTKHFIRPSISIWTCPNVLKPFHSFSCPVCLIQWLTCFSEPVHHCQSKQPLIMHSIVH
jgi:hypothetical protein